MHPPWFFCVCPDNMCDSQSETDCRATPGCTWYGGTCMASTQTRCGKYTTYETCQNAANVSWPRSSESRHDGLHCAWAHADAPVQCASFPSGRSVELPMSWWMPTPMPASTHTPAPPPDPWTPNLLCFQPQGCMEVASSEHAYRNNSGGSNAWQSTRRPNPCANQDEASCPVPACTWARGNCVPVPCANYGSSDECGAAAGCHWDDAGNPASCVQTPCSAYTSTETCETGQCRWSDGACEDFGYSCDCETGMCYRNRFQTLVPYETIRTPQECTQYPHTIWRNNDQGGFCLRYSVQCKGVFDVTAKPQGSVYWDFEPGDKGYARHGGKHLNPNGCSTAEPTGSQTAEEARTACLQRSWCGGCVPNTAVPTVVPTLCTDPAASSAVRDSALCQAEQDKPEDADGKGRYVLELLQQRSQLGQAAPRILVYWSENPPTDDATGPVLKYLPSGYSTSNGQSCNALLETAQSGGLSKAPFDRQDNPWSTLCQRAEDHWKAAAREPSHLGHGSSHTALVPGEQFALLTRLATDNWGCSASAQGSHMEAYACNFPRYFPVQLRHEDEHGLPLGIDAATGRVKDTSAKVQLVSPPPVTLGTFERFNPETASASGGTPAPCAISSTGDLLVPNLACSCTSSNVAQCTGGGPASPHAKAPGMYLQDPLTCQGPQADPTQGNEAGRAGGVSALQAAYPLCMAYHLCQLQTGNCRLCSYDGFEYGANGIEDTLTHCLESGWAGTDAQDIKPACFPDSTIEWAQLAKACNVSELEDNLYYSQTFVLGESASQQDDVAEAVRQWQDLATSQEIWRGAVEGDDALLEALFPFINASAFAQSYAQTFRLQNGHYAPDDIQVTPNQTASSCPAYAVTQTCDSLRFDCTSMPIHFSEYNAHRGALRSYVTAALVHIPLALAAQQQKDLTWVLGSEDPWGCAHLPDCDECCKEQLTCCRSGYCCAESSSMCQGSTSRDHQDTWEPPEGTDHAAAAAGTALQQLARVGPASSSSSSST